MHILIVLSAEARNNPPLLKCLQCFIHAPTKWSPFRHGREWNDSMQRQNKQTQNTNLNSTRFFFLNFARKPIKCLGHIQILQNLKIWTFPWLFPKVFLASQEANRFRGRHLPVKEFFFSVEFCICLKYLFIKQVISHSRRKRRLFGLLLSCPSIIRSKVPKSKYFSDMNLSFLKISSLFERNLLLKESWSGLKNSSWEL